MMIKVSHVIEFNFIPGTIECHWYYLVSNSTLLVFTFCKLDLKILLNY